MILNPLRIKNIKLLNRVVISPMCQYSSNNGNPTDWHYEHLLKLSRTGAGLMMIESTAVNKIGRITYKDLMLSNKENEENLKKLVKFINNI